MATKFIETAGSLARKASIAVIGAGRMGSIRLTNLVAHPRVKVVGIHDTSSEQLQRLSQLNHHSAAGLKNYESFDDAVSDVDIDGIWLTTPTPSHKDQILLAAANKKAVFTEKPVCDQPGDILTCFQAMEEAGVPLVCGFQRRFDDAYVGAKTAIAEGQIGNAEIITVRFRDHPCPPEEFLATGGDPFRDLAPHDIDYVRNMLQMDPQSVYAIGSSFRPKLNDLGVLDTALIVLHFPNGVICTIDMSRSSSYGYDNRVDIFGSKGDLAVLNVPKVQMSVTTASGATHSNYVHSFPERFAQAFASECNHFVEVLLDGAAPVVTKEDCIMTQAIADAAFQSNKKATPIDFTAYKQRLGEEIGIKM